MQESPAPPFAALASRTMHQHGCDRNPQACNENALLDGWQCQKSPKSVPLRLPHPSRETMGRSSELSLPASHQFLSPIGESLSTAFVETVVCNREPQSQGIAAKCPHSRLEKPLHCIPRQSHVSALPLAVRRGQCPHQTLEGCPKKLMGQSPMAPSDGILAA